MNIRISQLGLKAEYKTQHPKSDIPALTGLRFVAAMTVAIAHGCDISLRVDHPSDLFSAAAHVVMWWGAFGMTLFFVLSGFVIHYNYRRTISEGRLRGVFEFFWARFARLYPLFAFVLVIDLFLSGVFSTWLVGDPRGAIAHMLSALPYYLTFTQSWVYRIVGAQPLIYQIGAAMPVTWSISTEWFFYLCYPAALVLLIRLARPSQAIAAVIVWSIIWAGIWFFVARHAMRIEFWAVSKYGPIAGVANGPDSYMRWLEYFSPYARVGEFVLGCLIAQLYVLLEGKPARRIERGIAAVLSVVAVASVPYLLYLMFVPGGTSIVRNLNNNFALAPSVAIILFCAARYNFRGFRVFSANPMVKFGEASYSIYLLHVLIFWVVMAAAPSPLPHGIWGETFVVARLVAMLATVLFVSKAVYLGVEDPARRFLRKLWTGHRPKQRIVFLAAAGALVCFLVVEVMNDTAIQALSSGIVVTRATYGGNCGAPVGNVTEQVRRGCAGKKTCSYVVDVTVLGDVAPGCSKDFTVDYVCAPAHMQFSASIPGEAGFKSVVTMDCTKIGAPRN